MSQRVSSLNLEKKGILVNYEQGVWFSLSSHRVSVPDWPGAREIPSSEKIARIISPTICQALIEKMADKLNH